MHRLNAITLPAHPFLRLDPPKSTGREVFGRPFVQRLAERNAPADDDAWGVFVSTLTELSARSIADSIRHWVLPRGVDEVIVTGGGARNTELIARVPLPAGADMLEVVLRELERIFLEVTKGELQ